MWIKMEVNDKRWMIMGAHAPGLEKKNHEATVLEAAERVCQQF